MSAAAQSGEGPLIFLVAGEPSGDQLGARLMRSLRRETAGAVRFAGLGGEQMAAEGLESLFPINELAVMGIFEVIPHALNIYRRIRQTVAAAKALRPAALVTIDSPSFSLAVSERLKGQGIPLIHYVAPSVWAWKAWRAKNIAGFLDHLLALLPFEPPYFEVHGLATTFVGHPVVEAEGGSAEEVKALRNRLEIDSKTPLLCVLPGSRKGEVRRLAPIFGQALAQLVPSHPGLQALVPTVANVQDLVREQVSTWPMPTHVLTGPADKYAAFAAADVALAASGTVAVELAVAGTPTIVAYRVNALSGAIAKRLLKIDYVSIPNLIEGREIQPELLQHNCTVPKLAAALETLLSDPQARQAQIQSCEKVALTLGKGGEPPSDRAAKQILSVIAGR